MRVSVFLALLGAIVVAAAASATSAARAPTVSCSSVITPVGDVEWRPRRVVLGVVDAPSAYLRQTVATGEARWPYWSKVGLVVRGGSPPVRVEVARGWRTRAAITWGDSGPTSALRIATCPPSSSLDGWNPYSGGFLLRSKSACVPLVFRVAGRAQTVRFGVGRRCGAS